MIPIRLTSLRYFLYSFRFYTSAEVSGSDWFSRKYFSANFVTVMPYLAEKYCREAYPELLGMFNGILNNQPIK